MEIKINNYRQVKTGDSFNYKVQKIKIKYECDADNKLIFYSNAG